MGLLSIVSDPLKRAAAFFAEAKTGNEVMVLYRIPGRFKIFAPPLLYAGGTGYKLREKLGKAPGVRALRIDDAEGTISVDYEPEVTSEYELFSLVHELLSPLLPKSSDEGVGAILKTQKTRRLKSIGYKAAVVVTLGYLVKIHFGRLVRWVLNPFQYWQPLAAVGFLVWIHRNSIDRGLGVAR